MSKISTTELVKMCIFAELRNQEPREEYRTVRL